ncbi:MAG: hypothetical protein NG784_15420 [Candidatus Jettenia sp.]|nr:hypothetical protein [Candidatus Jettenia sp.]
MILYSRINSSRKKEFQLLTRILEEEGTKHVEKLSLSPESQDFLYSFLAKYELLNRIEESLPFQIVKCSKDKQSDVRFDFVEGETLFWQMENLFIQEKWEQLEELVEKYKKDIVYRLPSTSYSPSKERIEIFGNSLEKSSSWVQPGILDLNFDNLIQIGKRETVLFDYEWVWDFALPADYIIFRAITNFVYSLAGKGYYVGQLEEMFNLVMHEDFIDAEYNFNSYVNGKMFTKETFTKIHYTFQELILPPVDYIQEQDKKFHIMQEEIDAQRNQIHDLKTELARWKEVTSRLPVKAAIKSTSLLKKLRK